MSSLFHLDPEEREGAEQIINRRLPLVRRAARRYLGRSPARYLVDEDELVAIGNETVVQTVLDLMLGESAAFDWSYTITIRVRDAMESYLDQVIAERDRFVALDALPESSPIVEPDFLDDILDSVVYSDGRRRLLDMVCSLGRKERTIVALHFGFVDGREWTYDEIGRVMGYSSGAYPHYLMQRAIKDLRHPFRARQFRDMVGLAPGQV